MIATVSYALLYHSYLFLLTSVTVVPVTNVELTLLYRYDVVRNAFAGGSRFFQHAANITSSVMAVILQLDDIDVVRKGFKIEPPNAASDNPSVQTIERENNK